MRSGVQHGPVRRRTHRADARVTSGRLLEGDRRRSRAARLAPAAAHARRASGNCCGVERHRGRLSARPVRSSSSSRSRSTRTPDAVAVVCEEQQLTYRRAQRARQPARPRVSRQRGVGPEVLVGLCVERSLEMVWALLGILKAGGAYVPLDPAYPAERLAFMLRGRRVPLLLDPGSASGRACPTVERGVLCSGCDDPAIDGRAMSVNPACRWRPENLAYVIYTSGSTGMPKGVADHARAAWSTCLAGTGAGSTSVTRRTVLDTASTRRPSTSRSGSSGLTLTRGRWSSIFRIDETRLSAAIWLREWLTAAGSHFASCSPRRWLQPLLEERWPHEFVAVESPADRRRLGSDAALVTACARFRQLNHVWTDGRRRSSTHLASDRLPQGDGRPRSRSGGRSQHAALSLDASHAAGADGGAGRALHRRRGPGAGYLNRPELTAERFVPDPFSAESRALGCTGRETWPATCRTGTWSFWAGATIR